MSREVFVTGYCRQLDAARMVEAEIDGKELTEVDCLYGSCRFQSQCAIAQSIEEQLK